MGPCSQQWMELRMRVILISWLSWLATSSTSKTSFQTHTHTNTQNKLHTHADTRTLWHLPRRQKGWEVRELGAQGQRWKTQRTGKKKRNTKRPETWFVDGEVVDLISRDHYQHHKTMNVICIPLPFLVLHALTHASLAFVIMDHRRFSIRAVVFVFSLIVLAGLTHFTCFQRLKITASDAVCTWRILVTASLSYISHYHNLLLTWFIIRTLVNY